MVFVRSLKEFYPGEIWSRGFGPGERERSVEGVGQGALSADSDKMVSRGFVFEEIMFS